MSVPPLGYKKWGLVDQGMVMDCAGPGVTPPYLYDHLAQTSLAKGFNHMVSSGKMIKELTFILLCCFD